MIRKLCSVMLCAFALLLLMGAAAVDEQAELMLAQEESVEALEGQTLETESDNQFEVNEESALPEGEAVKEEPVALFDELVLIDGENAPIEIGRVQKDNTTYVSLAGMAKALDATAQAAWDGATGTVTVTTANLTITARLGQPYVVANGRYLYLPQLVGQNNGTVMVPMSIVTKAFDARLNWDAATGKVMVTRGSGALVHGDQFYNQDDLFWLSRVIHAESGNQSLEGKLAVGNVILNRVSNPIFPDSIHGVLAQKNQFSTYKSGRLANRNPNEASIIAAKLVLDGAVLEETEGALWFDSCRSSWASRNKTCLAVIGGHKFFA